MIEFRALGPVTVTSGDDELAVGGPRQRRLLAMLLPEESGMVDIRSATTGETVREFRGDDVDVNHVRYSLDGTKLAVAGDDGTADVFDPETGERLFSVVGSGPSLYPSFSDDGMRLLTYWPAEMVVRIADLATATSTEFRDVGVSEIRISPDGRGAVAAGGDPQTVAVYGSSGQPVVTFDEIDDFVGYVRWRPDGQAVAVADAGGVITVFDAVTGDRLAIGSGHRAQPTSMEWNRDGTRLATGSYDGTARVWEVRGSRVVEIVRYAAQDLSGGVAGVAFSPDGERLAVSDFGISSTKIVDISATGGGELANIDAEYFNDASGDVEAGKVVLREPGGSITVFEPSSGDRLVELGTVAWHVDMSPDGEALVIGDDAAAGVRIVDAFTGDVQAELSTEGIPWRDSWAWSPDGELIALNQGPTFRVVDRQGAELRRWSVDGVQHAYAMKFSADGSHVISVGYGTDRADPELDVVSVWDWRTGERVQVLATKGGSAPAVDPAGRYIAISRFNGNEVDIWDASSYELVATLTNSPALIRNLSFSPDGTRLVSAGFDGALRVWDTATWDEQQRIDTPNPLVNAWFVDDETITSIDQTGMARTWTLDLDELIAIATSPLTRELTDAECRQYLQLDVCPVA